MLFGGYIVGYLFCAGAGAGAFFIAAIGCMWDALRKTARTERFALAVQPGFYLAPCLMLAACVLLVADLGVAQRAWAVVLMPFQSIMSMGAWLVALFTAASAVLALAGAVFAEVPRRLQQACIYAGAPLAFGVMLYTGMLLSSMTSVDFWHTPWLVVLFAVSSLSAGTAGVIACDVLLVHSAEHVACDVWRLAGLLGLAEVFALAVMLGVQYCSTPVARASCDLLLTGTLSLPFWGGVVGAGLAVPLGVHVLNGLAARVQAGFMLAASAGVIAGSILLRYCVVAAALYTPLALGAL